MLTKTKLVLAAALILGTASAALASNSGEDRGGFVMPGSMDGVNPAYHPGWFPNYAKGDNGNKAYGFVPAAKQKPAHRASHERIQER